jgi:protein gp37
MEVPMNGPNNPIGWCDYTWNPVKGLCPEACEYCYARRIYARFHYDPEIRLDEKELMAPYKLKKPGAKIFCGSTIEMFHQDIHGVWLQQIIQVIKDNPQHAFLFLYHFSPHRGLFPSNCWLGLTVTSYIDAQKAITFSKTYPNHTKFVSFEPLLGNPKISDEVFKEIDWMIIGAETGNRKGKIKTRVEWIQQLIDKAEKYDLPIYMKNNLDTFQRSLNLRKEFPKKK